MPAHVLPSPILARRRFLALLGASAALPVATACSGKTAQPKVFPVNYSEAEWRRRLTPAQFYILRQKGTERPGSSALLGEHRKGTFVCAADGNPLYASTTKQWDNTISSTTTRSSPNAPNFF